MAEPEYHVASFVVSCRAQHAAELTDFINAIDGLEVHVTGDTKLIVVAEASDQRKLANLADEVRSNRHVIMVAPVYHEYMTAESSVTESAHPYASRNGVPEQ